MTATATIPTDDDAEAPRPWYATRRNRLHALATVTFGIDHIVSGVAINIIAAGTVRFLADQFFTGQPGGSISQGPPVKGSLHEQSLPFLSGGDLFGWRSPNPLQWIERKQ